MQINVVIINPADTVGVVTEPLSRGDLARLANGESFSVLNDIPVYHKIALKDIAAGEKIVKYEKCIGQATENIKKGQHVHSHNLVSLRQSF